MKITKKIYVSLFLLLSLTTFTACSSLPKVLNIDNSNKYENYSYKKMEHAIIQAGQLNNWNMYKINKNLITAYNGVDKFIAVEIFFDKNGYKINYKESSIEYKYDSEKETIHPNYNKLVQNLSNSIDNLFHNSH
jgi:hypothetical protein